MFSVFVVMARAAETTIVTTVELLATLFASVTVTWNVKPAFAVTGVPDNPPLSESVSHDGTSEEAHL